MLITLTIEVFHFMIIYLSHSTIIHVKYPVYRGQYSLARLERAHSSASWYVYRKTGGWFFCRRRNLHSSQRVLDNSIDEFVMGAGKSIEIRIKDKEVRVRDYGRGIPLGKVVDVVSKMNTEEITCRPLKSL